MMRSAEIAEIAGVTVRTIRHYHQIGILPEPPRLANGYRNYTADHLVTLLRITKLTDSGLSLAQAGTLAAGSAESIDTVLIEVDRTLKEQIAVLTKQRELLAQARTSGHVGLSKVAAALSVSSADIPSAVLLAHLYNDAPQLDTFAEALMEPNLRAALLQMQERFDTLDESSTDEELEELTTALRSIIPKVSDEIPPLTNEQSQLVLEVAERGLTDRQQEFLRLHPQNSD
jgi:DNA-binding transcriptional MerR regulator